MSAPWLVAMDWRDTLFLHWPVHADALRPFIPNALPIDEFDGTAWIGIVAFRIAGARPRGLPAAIGLPSFGEVNVRTYVGGAKPGVWFFSLDAANPVIVESARAGLHLAYYHAAIDTEWRHGNCAYRVRRTDRRSTASQFAATARVEERAHVAAAGTLEHFFAERYCFYSVDRRGRILRGDVAHPPWPIRNAHAVIEANTLFPTGIDPSARTPIAHASSGVTVHAYPPTLAERHRRGLRRPGV
jgi:hypothetical protein